MTNASIRQARWAWIALPLCAFLATAALAEESETLVLEAGQEGKAFDALTVEGEDRVQVEFQRPELTLNLEPMSVAGLEGGSTRDLLLASEPDLMSGYIANSLGRGRNFRPLAWFDDFATGTLVRFRPELEDVSDWSLTLADSRGDTVIMFSGKGEPPEEIGWNGRRQDGGFALPGLVHSHVLQAYDRAGNERNFVGKGFTLPPYRLDAEGGFALLMTGADLRLASGQDRGATPSLLLGAAHHVNQAPPDWPLQLVVTARDYDRARNLAERTADALKPHLLGDPMRLQLLTEVDPRAPVDAGVRLSCRPAPPTGD